MSESRKKLYEMCDKTNTRRSGIDFLVNYYIESLHLSEDEACEYALGLFKNGTIQNIKLIGKDGNEL